MRKIKFEWNYVEMLIQVDDDKFTYLVAKEINEFWGDRKEK